MFIDIHVHPDFYEPVHDGPERYNARHEALGIHKNGLAPLEHVFNQMRCAGIDRLCLLGHDCGDPLGPLVSNEEVRALIDAAPDRFIGFASVDPKASDAPACLERAFSELRLSGLKLDTARCCLYPYDERLEPLYSLCEAYDRPVLFHAGLSLEPGGLCKYAHPLEFEEVAARHPRLRMCLAHFGWPWVREAAALMLKYPNVYADTAMLYFDSAYEFYDRVFRQELAITWIDRSLRHQVMFGSDNPRFEQIRMADALSRLGLRDETLDLIKGTNAVEFLGGSV